MLRGLRRVACPPTRRRAFMGVLYSDWGNKLIQFFVDVSGYRFVII